MKHIGHSSVLWVVALAVLGALPGPAVAQITKDWPYHNVIRDPRFEPADLTRLNWAVGAWRISTSGQADAYQVIRFVNDSTMSVTYYADPELHRATGNARLYLSAGRIFEVSGPSRWSATLIDGHGARFRPEENALDDFVWMEQTPDQWTETRRSGAVGLQRVVISTMTRLK